MKQKIIKLFEENNDFLIDKLKEIAIQSNMPEPIEEIGSGSDATVYSTKNKNIVLRVQPVDSEDEAYSSKEISIFADEDIQETGGVVKLYYFNIFNINNQLYLLTWKERIEENYEPYLYKKYGDDITHTILSALNLYDPFYNREKLKILNQYKETKKLYNAVKAGLPTSDLAHDSNLGITKKHDIVAFDV